MQLTTNFTLEEFIQSDTADRLNIINYPTSFVLDTLKYTATQMEIVRSILKNPIQVTSGFRCLSLNAAIGSKSTSQHVKGEAVDFKCPKFGSPRLIVQTLKTANLVFDQLILEFDNWVHISFVRQNSRQQVLIIDKAGTRLFS